MTDPLAEFAAWMKLPPEGVRAKGALTIAAYLSTAGRYLAFLKKRPVSTETARLFLQELGKTNKPRSVARHIDGLRAFFKSRGLKLDVSHPRWEQTLPRVLTEKELLLVLATAQNAAQDPALTGYGRYRAHFRRAVVFVYLGAGIRLREGCTLLVEHVHRDSPTEGSIRVMGKGGRERLILVEGEVLEAIEDWLKVRRHSSPYVFAGKAPGKPISKHPIEAAIKEVMAEAGIRGVHVHTLRHSFGTALKRHGADLDDIRQQMGHRRIETTEIYVHLTQDERRDRLPAVIGTTRHRSGEKNLNPNGY